MNKKALSSLVFAAVMGAGMVSVTSCADYDEDIKALQNQVNSQGSVQETLKVQLDGMTAQIAALQASLNAMKSCQCGDIDQKVADQIAKALAAHNYATPADVEDAIKKALDGIKPGLTQEEVEGLVKAYHDAHPGCSCGDIEALVKKYLADNPGLSEDDVEKIVKAYHDAHPASSLTEADVKSIVETYINQVQHFTKEQIEAIINTAITQALANYVEKSDVYTKGQVEELINAAIKNVQPGLSQDKVQELIDAALKSVESGLSESEVKGLIEAALKDVKPGLTKEEVQELIDAAKCQCPSLTSQDVTNIASSVVEKYMKEHPYTLDSAVVENICNSVINNSQVINNLKGAISTLQTTVEGVQKELQGLKDNVYTKSEVENLINMLIAQAVSGLTPSTSLSAQQQSVVNGLINDAINKYNAAHPDCNCQYDAVAFQALVDAVNANTEAIKGIKVPTDYVTNDQLLQAIKDVKDLIPSSPDLSDYLTVATYNNAMVAVNTAINEAKTKAENAYEKALANETAISDLKTSVKELEALYNQLSSDLDAVARKAENAQARALSNYFEIETLKSLYQTLQGKVDAIAAQGYDDTEIKNRLAELENSLNDLASKDELEKQIGIVNGLVADARTHATNVANNAAAKALADAKDYANSEISKVRNDFANADQQLQNQIDTINDKLDEINETLDELQQKVETLVDKVSALTKLITNIELQGSVNPAFGYYSLPLGVTSNVLIAYYGKNDHKTYFPRAGATDLEYDDEENWITSDDKARLGFSSTTISGGTTFLNGQGNAGKLYLTLNPSNVDFTGTTLALVNSLGEESPIALGALKKSTDKLTFGQSRAANAFFYEAPATVKKDKVSEANFQINEQLTSMLEDIVKNKSKASISELAQAVYNQFNGVLDAYAVQASWNDANGEHTVTSNYGIAATAIKPLGYHALRDFAGKGPKLPNITPLSELNINLNDYIKVPKFDFTFDGIDAEKFKNDFKVEIHFGDLWVESDGSIWTNVYMTQYVKGDNDIASAPEKIGKEEKFCLVNADGTFRGDIYDFEGGVNPGVLALTEDQRKAVNAMVALIVEDRAQTWSTQLQQGFQNQMMNKIGGLVDDINKMIADVSSKLEGNLNGKLQDMINSANNKLNSALGKADVFVNQLNNLINEVNKVLGNGNPNIRLQSQVFYADAKGCLHPMSTVKAIPTVVTGDGEGVELNLSSYTGEILAPSFRKYVAVTNVYRGDDDADTDPKLMEALKHANSVDGFNTVISGDRYAVVFSPDKSVKGVTYEIVYSSLDFYGTISQRKYYVTVK